MEGSINLLWELRQISTAKHLHAVIFNNLPARDKVDAVEYHVDLRPPYRTNTEDDLYLWYTISSDVRTRVTLLCHRSGFHLPAEDLRPIPFISWRRMRLLSVSVSPIWDCTSPTTLPEGPTFSRLTRTVASAFASAFTLVAYSQESLWLQNAGTDPSPRVSLGVETRDFETVERCLSMVSRLG